VFHNRYQNRVNDLALRIVGHIAECLQQHELRKRALTDQLVDEILSPYQHIVSVIRTYRRCGFVVGLAVHQGLPDGEMADCNDRRDIAKPQSTFTLQRASRSRDRFFAYRI
jgi:hypothetical protein